MKDQILQLFTKLNKIIEDKIETGELNKDIKFHSGIIPNKEWRYSSQEEERWYLWLCLVQKWIWTNYKIWIKIIFKFKKQSFYFNIYNKGKKGTLCFIDYGNKTPVPYHNFETAFEDAIYSSLQLIINLYEKEKEN